MAFYKVKDHADLVRDTNSNAILNTNSSTYAAVLARKRKNKHMKQELSRMKNEISELKNLVNTLINKQ